MNLSCADKQNFHHSNWGYLLYEDQWVPVQLLFKKEVPNLINTSCCYFLKINFALFPEIESIKELRADKSSTHFNCRLFSAVL